ncbi:Uncharacterised protein [BD1-7 clade bacterium]|uniref:DUF1330 domain-containing protein n=1 Tax=BD1-7 clade bacterium TaxID=2029982 RepID=A0A5S9QDS2_9GAMM|nr:Uncharacterised protein [BD1-7 clade bacterium]CAA0116546.1 Uncharacterised protein [BD1-7 clade bacterium]
MTGLAFIILYVVFFAWYEGYSPLTRRNRRILPNEVDAILQQLQAMSPEADSTHDHLTSVIPTLLKNDTGKGFLMVNLLAFNEPKRESIQALESYSKPFMQQLLKHAGHPVLMSKVIGKAIEYWGLPRGSETWDAVAIVRYRSCRDLVEMALWPKFEALHPYKKQALKKTLAIPIRARFFTGSVHVLVVLTLLLMWALIG